MDNEMVGVYTNKGYQEYLYKAHVGDYILYIHQGVKTWTIIDVRAVEWQDKDFSQRMSNGEFSQIK